MPKVGEDLLVQTCIEFVWSFQGFIEAYDSSTGAYGGRAIMYCNIIGASPGGDSTNTKTSLEELKAASAK